MMLVDNHFHVGLRPAWLIPTHQNSKPLSRHTMITLILFHKWMLQMNTTLPCMYVESSWRFVIFVANHVINLSTYYFISKLMEGVSKTTVRVVQLAIRMTAFFIFTCPWTPKMPAVELCLQFKILFQHISSTYQTANAMY